MSGDIKQFIETQKQEILEEKKRLDLLEKWMEDEIKENLEKRINSIENNEGEGDKRNPLSEKNEEPRCDKSRISVKDDVCDKQVEDLSEENKENRVEHWQLGDKADILGPEKVPSAVGPLDLSRCYDRVLNEKKQAFIDRLTNTEEPFSPFSYRPYNEAPGFDVLGGGTPFGLPVLKRGEYAPPRHPRLRAAPHEGLGEYEIRRGLEARKRQRDYLRVGAKKNKSPIRQVLTGAGERPFEESPRSDRSTNTEFSVDTKSVQTDIQNICSELVVKHYPDFQPSARDAEISPRRTVTDELVDAALRKRPFRYQTDQRLTTAQNEILLKATSYTTLGTDCTAMDKPKSILSNRRTGSPRERYTSDLGHSSYGATSFIDGFSYTDRSEELERERAKREAYQHDLRLQIEEKRHLAALRDEQERRERDLENRRLEQQLSHMREDLAHEDRLRQKRNELMRRHSDDLLRRKTELHEMQRPWRRQADSESANLDRLGLGTSPSSYGALGGYSPPVSRKAVSPYSPSSYNVPATSVFQDSSSSRYNPSRFDSSSYPGSILRKTESPALRRLESLNSYPNSYDTVPLPRTTRTRFDRFDSLSRIDALSHRMETMSVRDGFSSDLTDVQRRHSATQQDLSLARSPRMRRRNSSSRFDDSLPIPVLKARSPVAKELRNAIPFSSHRSSDAHRRLEDRWQIPAVQKNILHPPSSLESPVGSRGSILTQLGSIRAQLQREQLRMDETLRRRGLMRTRTTEDY